MLAGDAVTLDRLVHRDCVYVHSSGFVDNGGAMVKKIAAGIVQYDRLDVDSRSVSVFGDVAVIVYRQFSRIRVAGEPHSSLTRCAAVWARNGGAEPWLVSFQSGRMDEE